MKKLEESGQNANIHKCLDILSNEYCSLIVFHQANKISGVLQLQKLRISISFEQEQFESLLAICENKIISSGQFKISKQPDETYPIILQVFDNIRLFLNNEEWNAICNIIEQTKTKYCLSSTIN